MTAPDPALERMQCMELWGGNTSVSRAVSTAGLEVRVHSRPYAGAVGGGDVHYVSSCASGRITRMLLADVSGHGDSAAQLAVSLRDLMRENVNLIDHTRFVREMNRQFTSQLKSDRFATAVVCTYFSPTQSLQICNAGHPVPLLYRADQQRWTPAESPADADGPADFPLGVIDGGDYTRLESRLANGDMLLCVSDAFTESLAADGQPLGAEGLLRCVEALDAASPEQIVPELLNRLAQEQPDNLQQDDATVILIRSVDSSPTLKDNLLAPLRLMGPVRDHSGLA